MRARKKKNTVPRLERVSEYLIDRIPDSVEGEIRVEVGCGKGKFITETAARNPDVSFFALEKIPDVIVMAAEKAAREQIPNVRFLLADAHDLTEGTDRKFVGLRDGEPQFADVAHTALCPVGSVSVLYLNFSDPLPNKKHAHLRLTSPEFLEKYKVILRPDGHLEFKTDNRPLFDFSVESLKESGYEIYDYTEDLHASSIPNLSQTEYEMRFAAQGLPIYSVKARVAK